MISREQIGAVMWDGGIVIGHDGQDLGRIAQVFLDALSSQPAWMTVTSDTWDGAELVVPLVQAQLDDGRVSVPYSAAVVQDAPRETTAQGYLGRQHERDLVRHYGLEQDRDVADGSPTDGRARNTALASAALAPVAAPGVSRREWRLPRTRSSVRALRLELRPFLDAAGLPGEVLDDLVLAACEAAANAIEHAGTPATGFFDVCADVEVARVRIMIRDYGRWQNPTPGNGRGRGLLMMSRLAGLTVTVETHGTTVTLRNRSADVDRWSLRRRL